MNAENVKIPLLQNDESPYLPKDDNIYLNANPLNKLFFGWIFKFVNIGRKIPFQQNMHYYLRKYEETEYNYEQFKKNWDKYRDNDHTIFKALFRTYARPFIQGFILSFIGIILGFSPPIFINLIIDYINSPQQNTSTAVYIMVGVGITRLLLALIQVQASFVYDVLGTNMNSMMNAFIYNKALKFSTLRSTEHSIGSITNHVQIDSQKLVYLSMYLSTLTVFPFQLVAGILILYYVVGIAFTAGLGIIILMTCLNFFNSKLFFRLQKATMKKKDERVKLSFEIMQAIKYIKMSGWEKYFLEKICNVRDQELRCIAKQFASSAFTVFSIWMTPTLVTTSIFAFYIILGNNIDAANAFTVVSTFWILQDPLRAFPRFINLLLESIVALKRIQTFLKAEEIDTNYIAYNNSSNLGDEENAISVINGNFYWNKEEKKAKARSTVASEKQIKGNDGKFERITINKAINNDSKISEILTVSDKMVFSEGLTDYLTLKNINFQIKKSSFVAIIGDVGSGKSSLISSLIGEMQMDINNPTQIMINGSLAYLSQKAWILNDTLKNNVLFGLEYNEEAYRNALKYSCLEQDLNALIKGDLTEIGERGVNLSGGQKARVSFARAIYSNRDIFLLDDPLSAVDAHVGAFILKECLCGYLAKKTRVLVTHNMDCIKTVDEIFIMKNGRIVEKGNYLQIQESELFKAIIEKYRKNETLEKEKEQEEQQQGVKKKGGGKGRLQQKDEIQDFKSEGSESNNKGKSNQVKAEEGKKEKDDDEEALMLPEDREIGKVSNKVYKAYIDYYGGFGFFSILQISLKQFLVVCRLTLNYNFLVMLFWITLQTASNFWLTYWTDSNDPNNTYFYLKIYAIFALSFAFFSLARSIMVYCRSISCSRKIHRAMFQNVLRAPMTTFFDRVPVGRIMNRFGKDLTILDSYIVISLSGFLNSIYSLLSDIVVCIYVGSYWVIPGVLFFFLLSLAIQKLYMKLNREVVRLESISRSPIVSFFNETLNGLTTIRGYHDEGRFFCKQIGYQNENTKNQILGDGLSSWFTLYVTLCSLFIVLPCVSICVVFVKYFNINPSLAGLLITYVLFIDDDIITFLWSISDFESKLISLERCLAFTKLPQEKDPNTKTSILNQYGSLDSWPSEGQLSFKNYWVKYRKALPFVLKNLEFDVNSMEKIGIVGRTGCGKSTLFLSILRILEPTQGQIFLDGVDITKLGLYQLRSKITIIPQDPILFKGTVRENLDLFEEFSDEQIWEALEMVCMKEKFSDLKGLQTDIKGDGDNLSSGEKQLMCIGRAILKRNKIILIDEATSNIDVVTEDTIIKTIKERLKSSTVLTIAHRLKTVINSDRILVLNEGSVVEFDTPSNLLNNPDSLFYSLWKQSQNGMIGEQKSSHNYNSNVGQTN